MSTTTSNSNYNRLAHACLCGETTSVLRPTGTRNIKTAITTVEVNVTRVPCEKHIANTPKNSFRGVITQARLSCLKYDFIKHQNTSYGVILKAGNGLETFWTGYENQKILKVSSPSVATSRAGHASSPTNLRPVYWSALDLL